MICSTLSLTELNTLLQKLIVCNVLASIIIGHIITSKHGVANAKHAK